MDAMKLFVSGGTGTLGSAFAMAAAERGHEVVLGVRGRGRVRADRRSVIMPKPRREAMKVVSIDVSLPLWGVEEAIGEVLADIDVVVNCAGVTDWAASWRELHAANVMGPIEAVRLANAIADVSRRPIAVVHIGSASAAAPDSSGLVPEGLRPLSPHASSYERSKWAGERAFLQKDLSALQRIVVRVPMLVSADAHDKWPRRQGLSALIELADRGWRLLPCNPTARVDALPRDIAANCIIDVIENQTEAPSRAVYHAVLGETAPSMRTVIEALNDLRRSQGLPRLLAVPVPARALTDWSASLDRLVRLPRRSRNRLIGLRYVADERIFARDRFAALVGTAHVPALTAIDIASRVHRAPTMASHCQIGEPPRSDDSFGLYHGF
jgi:nucleoside-diphosphate-sugar epimerase